MSTPSKIQNDAQHLINLGSTEEIRKLASLIKDLAKHVESQPSSSPVRDLVRQEAAKLLEKK